MADEGIRQRKVMAMGGGAKEGGSFGVKPFHEVNGSSHSMGDSRATILGDHERGVGQHVARGKGAMPAQRHPDHGPHMHREEHGSFGVESFKSMNG